MSSVVRLTSFSRRELTLWTQSMSSSGCQLPSSWGVRRFGEDGKQSIALVPGRYRITIYGENIATRSEVVTLHSGQTLQRSYALPSAIDFWMNLQPPSGCSAGIVIIRGPDGSEVFREEVDANDPFGSRWRPALLPGPNVADFVGTDGLRFRASFVARPQPAPVGDKPEPFAPQWLPN